MRIGFLGGTFDPPHRGHVELALLARRRLGLERVLLAPAGIQPLKQGEPPGATWEQRLEMVRLAVEGHAGLDASDQDAPRQGGRPNYSVETVARLKEGWPGTEVFFLLGADAFAGLQRWHDPEGLVRLCELAVASRPGMELPPDGNSLLRWMPEGARFLGMEESLRMSAHVFLVGGAMVRLYLLQELAEDIAASSLRAMLAEGGGLEWLPGGAAGALAAFLRQQRLYGM